MACNAEHARKLSRQYVCSLHFSETDFTLGDETSLDRLAVPNPSTLQFSLTSISVIITFSMTYIICKESVVPFHVPTVYGH
jgi:heme/copper-type cytochrome/quinol oxidase subunit 2